MAMVIVLGFVVLLANAEKRILLNDPDMILSQLKALERKMEDMSTWKADMTIKYNTLLTQTNEMHAKMVNIPTQMCKSFLTWV